jgi:hypothetical protein
LAAWVKQNLKNDWFWKLWCLSRAQEEKPSDINADIGNTRNKKNSQKLILNVLKLLGDLHLRTRNRTRLSMYFTGRHNIQHNDTQYDEIERKDIQHE